MESYFSGLCKELSHSRHHNTGERSPTAKWHVLQKNSTLYSLSSWMRREQTADPYLLVKQSQ